jgi:LPXTG-motif cell wall-anchored protein
MFSVRGSVPRILTVLSLTGFGLVGLASAASAHTGTFTRDCDSVTLHLTAFKQSPDNDPNVVEVFRNGTKIDTVTFTASSATKSYPQVSTGAVTFKAAWTNTGADNHSGQEVTTLPAPSGCTPPPPPCQAKGAFTYTFDGPAGRATVTLSGETPLCAPVTVLLASYRTQGATWETSGHQTVADQVSQVITKPGSYPLRVAVPDCYTQVDLYVTDRKAVDFDFPNSPLSEFLAYRVWPNAGPPSKWNGGTTACEHPPSPSPSGPPPTRNPPAVAPPAAAAPAGSSLPETGASPLSKIGIAVLLLATGTGLVLLGRRRRTTH